MNQAFDYFDDFINNNPKESFQLLLALACFIWQTPVSVLGGLIYFIIRKIVKIKWWYLFIPGLIFACISFSVYSYDIGKVSLQQYIVHGFAINKLFWSKVIKYQGWEAIQFLYQYGKLYWLGLPLLLTGILRAIDLIEDDVHKKAIKALKNGEHVSDKKEMNEKAVQIALKRIDENKHDGTVLGVSKYNGKPVVIPDYFINQVMLVLGTTGAGKTITLRRFYKRAIIKGYPLVIVDGKPTDENVKSIQELAIQHNRKFYGFNCGNHASYDALADGGYTELKDKIISLKDQWENDYYKSIAEDYLQATFQILMRLNIKFDLAKVIECLDYDVLLELVRETNDPILIKRAARLGSYKKEDISGLQAHLSLLVNSELGHYFTESECTFSLKQVFSENAVVYFALPALRYPSFSKVLGKLVVNDLKAVIDRNDSNQKRIFMIFDEFSVFAGEQVLNLVNMGRGKGVHAVFGTQGLADLSRVDKEFKSQILNCANTIICHRLNDQESAETVAAWMGTADKFTLTAQYNSKDSQVGLGSITEGKGFIVHPEEIKRGLGVGEVYVTTKVNNMGSDKVLVKY